MEQKYLIDTCVIVKYLEDIFFPEAAKFLDALVDVDSNVSFITKIELLVWNPPNPSDILVREEFLNGSKIYYINDDIILLAIDIRKSTNIKIPDSIIAATAIHYGFTLLSTNENDFSKVVPLGLSFLNPEKHF